MNLEADSQAYTYESIFKDPSVVAILEERDIPDLFCERYPIVERVVWLTSMSNIIVPTSQARHLYRRPENTAHLRPSEMNRLLQLQMKPFFEGPIHFNAENPAVITMSDNAIGYTADETTYKYELASHFLDQMRRPKPQMCYGDESDEKLAIFTNEFRELDRENPGKPHVAGCTTYARKLWAVVVQFTGQQPERCETTFQICPITKEVAGPRIVIRGPPKTATLTKEESKAKQTTTYPVFKSRLSERQKTEQSGQWANPSVSHPHVTYSAKGGHFVPDYWIAMHQKILKNEIGEMTFRIHHYKGQNFLMFVDDEINRRGPTDVPSMSTQQTRARDRIATIERHAGLKNGTILGFPQASSQWLNYLLYHQINHRDTVCEFYLRQKAVMCAMAEREPKEAVTALLKECYRVAIKPTHYKRDWMINISQPLKDLRVIVAKYRERGLTE